MSGGIASSSYVPPDTDTDSFDAFTIVQKNRNSCIHWILQLARRIERDWTDDDLRRERLGLLRRCLESCQTHAHADCRELGALAPRMLRRLDFDERHFLNLMLPIERKYSKGLRDHEFLGTVTTDDRPDASSAAKLPLHLVLDHLRSAFNVGALFRTADCLGVEKMWLCGYTATPEDSTVVKTSMGAHAHVDWEWRQQTAAAIDELRARGVPIVGLETVANAPLASEYAFPRSGCALVLGNERHGLSEEVLSMCDAVVRLPTRGVKNSMNVAVSCGMCGYEIARQWMHEGCTVTTPVDGPGSSTSPEDAAALMAAANAHAEAGEWVAAAALFRVASGTRPCSKALEGLAQCLLEMDDAEGAAAAATKATEDDPEWAFGFLTLGRAKLNAKAFGEASAALRRAIALDPALAEEAEEDAATAERLHLESTEEVMTLDSVCATLRLRQADPEPTTAAAGEKAPCTAGCMDRNGGLLGHAIWESGIVLSKLLDLAAAGGGVASSPLHTLGILPLAGKRVLELGSGSGIAGLAAAALGAHVVLTDVPEVVPLLEANAKRNAAVIAQAGGSASVQALQWETPDELPDGAKDCEIVLASDLLYQRDGKQLTILCEVLRRVMSTTTRLLLTHKARHAALDEALPGALREHAGIALVEVPFEQHHPEFRSPSVSCFVGALQE